MAEKTVTYKCLRCMYEYEGLFDAKAAINDMIERACPKCKSNSIRRMKEKK